jgi:hypothetical protein
MFIRTLNKLRAFVVDKVTQGQTFSDFFGFHLPISFHRGSPFSYRG